MDEVVAPEGWKNREMFVALEAAHRKGGVWVEAIDRVFPEQWLLEQVDSAHEVVKAMCWSWDPAVHAIADVAELICAARHATDGADSLEGRLRVHEQYQGALFEARVARFLVEAGLPFRFGSSKGDTNTADIMVEGDRPFAIEIKSRQRAFRTAVEDALTSRVYSAVFMEALGHELMFDWSGEALQTLRQSQETSRQLHAMTARAVAALRARLPHHEAGTTAVWQLDSLGTVTLRPVDSDAHSSSAGTVSSPERDANRLANAMSKAARQLPKSRPGIIFLCARAGVVDSDAAQGSIRALLERQGHELSHVAGAVLLVVTANNEIQEQSWPIANPHSPQKMRDLPLRILREPARSVRVYGRIEAD